jgi:TonB-linked SusC/RagA family outer membrane protein
MTYNKIIIKILIGLTVLFTIDFEGMTVSAQNQDTIIVPEKDEMIQLGYSSQKSAEISGAVASMKGEVLQRSPVANLTQTFAGRFPGLFTRETNSTLSKTSTLLNVRGVSRNSAGSPIIIIDGTVFNYMIDEILRNYILPEEIESVTILKDASTQALYGSQGANGVIVITTRQGSKGKLRITANFHQSFQKVTTKPTFIHAAEYAELRNEAAYNDWKGQNIPLFSDEEIENYRSGSDRDLYPDNNWYNRYFNDYALMQRSTVNLSGGNENIRYFSNLGMMHQGGQFKTDQPKYDSGYNDIRINFRSNVQAKLHKHIEAYLFMNGSVIRNRLPGNNSAADVYASMFCFPSTLYGPVTPERIDPETNEVLQAGGEVITSEVTQTSTYGMLNRSGFTKNTQTNVSSQFGLNFDLGFLAEGLKASGTLAYQTFSYNNLTTLQNYERWVRTNETDQLNFQKIGTYENTPLNYGKYSREYKNITYKGIIDYQHDFGKHGVGGLAYASYQHLERDDRTAPWNIPVNRLDMGFEGTYHYAGKYLVKVDAGYSGTDFYSRDNRYLVTPAVSGAWVISKESFMKEIDWLDHLKFRVSYGKTGSEYVDSRYSYLDDIEFVKGGPITEFQYIVNEVSYGNPNIKPEISRKQNYGIDLGLFNSLAVSVDVFKERMENMVISGTGTIPAYQGIPLSIYPSVNQGIFENEGYDVEIDYNKSFKSGLSVSVGGFISYAKNKVIAVNETSKTEDYAYRYRTTGYSYGQEFGYLVDYSNGSGFFNSEDEIDVTYDFGTPRAGDLRYKDLNDDGIINEKDKAPVGTGSIPRYYYGFNGEIRYKDFDLNFLFQGVGQWTSIYSGMGVFETSYEGVFGSLHRNAWTRERYENGAPITSPALSLVKSTNHEVSDYYNYNRSYLRFKNIELGYTLPGKTAKAVMAEKIRFFLSGQNLLTWDKMKSDDFGPEGSYASIPVYRVYNIGLSVDF